MTGSALAEAPPVDDSIDDQAQDQVRDDGQEPAPRKDPDPEPRGELVAEGTVQVGKLKAGGKSPTHGTLKFEGLKEITLPDKMGYQKGNVVYITGLATVIAVGERDKRDGVTKQTVDCKQQHIAAIDDFRVVNEPVIPIARVQKALTEIAELASAGDMADVDAAIMDKLEELASLS